MKFENLYTLVHEKKYGILSSYITAEINEIRNISVKERTEKQKEILNLLHSLKMKADLKIISRKDIVNLMRLSEK